MISSIYHYICLESLQFNIGRYLLHRTDVSISKSVTDKSQLPAPTVGSICQATKPH